MSLLLFIFGFPMITFTYAFSFLFESYGSAQTWVFLLYFTSGNLICVALYLMRFYESTRDISLGLGYFLKLFPSVLFGNSILDISNAELYDSNVGISTDNLSLWDWRHSGQNVFYLFLDTFLYSCVIIFYEKNWQKKITLKMTKPTPKPN